LTIFVVHEHVARARAGARFGEHGSRETCTATADASAGRDGMRSEAPPLRSEPTPLGILGVACT